MEVQLRILVPFALTFWSSSRHWVCFQLAFFDNLFWIFRIVVNPKPRVSWAAFSKFIFQGIAGSIEVNTFGLRGESQDRLVWWVFLESEQFVSSSYNRDEPNCPASWEEPASPWETKPSKSRCSASGLAPKIMWSQHYCLNSQRISSFPDCSQVFRSWFCMNLSQTREVRTAEVRVWDVYCLSVL